MHPYFFWIVRVFFRPAFSYAPALSARTDFQRTDASTLTLFARVRTIQLFAVTAALTLSCRHSCLDIEWWTVKYLYYARLALTSDFSFGVLGCLASFRPPDDSFAPCLL